MLGQKLIMLSQDCQVEGIRGESFGFANLFRVRGRMVLTTRSDLAFGFQTLMAAKSMSANLFKGSLL